MPAARGRSWLLIDGATALAARFERICCAVERTCWIPPCSKIRVMAAKGLGGAWPRKVLGLSVAGRANAGGCPERCAASYGRLSSWCSRASWSPTRTRTARCSYPSGSTGSPRVQLDGAWRRARGVLIDTDVTHAFDCDGQLTAIGWIEGETG